MISNESTTHNGAQHILQHKNGFHESTTHNGVQHIRAAPPLHFKAKCFLVYIYNMHWYLHGIHQRIKMVQNIYWKKKQNGIKVENEPLDASELLIEETND
eukprot:495575_1